MSVSVTAEGYVFEIVADENQSVTAEACTNLSSGDWETVGEPFMVPAGNRYTFADPAGAPAARRYYRVVLR